MNERKEGDDQADSLFHVVLLVLRDSDLPFARYAILLFIEFLQLMQFAFSRNVSHCLSVLRCPRPGSQIPYIPTFQVSSASLTSLTGWI